MFRQKPNPWDAGINKRHIPIQTLRDYTIHSFARLLFKERYETNPRGDCLTDASVRVGEVLHNRRLLLDRRHQTRHPL